jgi:choline kinase
MWHYFLRKSILDNLVIDMIDYFCMEVDTKEDLKTAEVLV